MPLTQLHVLPLAAHIRSSLVRKGNNSVTSKRNLFYFDELMLVLHVVALSILPTEQFMTSALFCHSDRER